MMIVIIQKRIYREDLKNNRHLLYIFGDNLQRIGMGGQAKEMRGEPNAFGFATKRNPEHGTDDCYFDDSDECFDIIRYEIKRFKDRLSSDEYLGIILPADGLGTGLAELPKRAPKLLEEINNYFYNDLHVWGFDYGNRK